MMIGREKEVKKLNELYNSQSSELVAVYGRRRVGKTYLVDEALAGKFTFRHAGLSPIEHRDDKQGKRRSRLKEQLRHFYQSLLMQGMKESRIPDSWLDAFYMLESFLAGKESGSDRLLVFLTKSSGWTRRNQDLLPL